MKDEIRTIVWTGFCLFTLVACSPDQPGKVQVAATRPSAGNPSGVQPSVMTPALTAPSPIAVIVPSQQPVARLPAEERARMQAEVTKTEKRLQALIMAHERDDGNAEKRSALEQGMNAVRQADYKELVMQLAKDGLREQGPSARP